MSYSENRAAALARLELEKGPMKYNSIVDLFYSDDGEGFEIRLTAFGYYIDRVMPGFKPAYNNLRAIL